MKGYLLDNNAISRWFSENANVMAKVASLPSGTPLMTSVITLGEAEFGHNLLLSTDPARREEYIRWLRDTFRHPLEVTRHTTGYYGDIRAELFRRFPPAGKRENHPEMCLDPVTGKELGIDENDLWLAAQALEHNLVLVSNDKMERIKTAAGRRLEVEDWEKP